MQLHAAISLCDSLHVTEHLSVRFLNRQHIVAHFVCEDVDREFQCGEFSRRTEGSYLDKVSSCTDTCLSLAVTASCCLPARRCWDNVGKGLFDTVAHRHSDSSGTVQLACVCCVN